MCGHISYESVQNFLRDFLHEDRENQNVKCIFLDRLVDDEIGGGGELVPEGVYSVCVTFAHEDI